VHHAIVHRGLAMWVLMTIFKVGKIPIQVAEGACIHLLPVMEWFGGHAGHSARGGLNSVVAIMVSCQPCRIALHKYCYLL
jgi:hypothetical protein